MRGGGVRTAFLLSVLGHMGAYPTRTQGALSLKMAAIRACIVPTLQVDFEMADFHLRITSAKAKKFSNPELQVHTRPPANVQRRLFCIFTVARTYSVTRICVVLTL